jgi:plastocyanin
LNALGSRKALLGGRFVRSVVVVVAITVGGACSSSGSASDHRLTIKGFAFHPYSLDIRPGQAIIVENRDTVLHGFTANDRSFNIGSIDIGASRRIVLARAGTFPYHCPIHVSMTGVIHVAG